MSEITDVELEALTFTYGEESLVVLHKAPLCIKINVAPHTGEVVTEQYVNATLLVTTSVAYPAEAPVMQLQNPQGMSDQRINKVIAQLSTEANNLLGEMMLGCLIETAKDTMTAMNQPEGHCIFCLEDLVPVGATPSQETLQRLPCYHCYHLQCFAEWWHWQQSDRQQKAAQIKKDLQSAAPQHLQQEGLIPNADGQFSVPCPVCRVIFSPQDVPHVHNCTKQAHQGSQEQQPITDSSSGFTPTELHRLMLQKQKRDRQFAKQQQQGAIVSEKYGTSIAAVPEQQQAADGVNSQDGGDSSHQQLRHHQHLQQRPQQSQQQHQHQNRSGVHSTNLGEPLVPLQGVAHSRARSSHDPATYDPAHRGRGKGNSRGRNLGRGPKQRHACQ